MNIDWNLLRRQKEWLLAQNAAEADGLVSLLDTIQDQAVASGEATELEVFGQEGA